MGVVFVGRTESFWLLLGFYRLGRRVVPCYGIEPTFIAFYLVFLGLTVLYLVLLYFT